MTDRSSSELLRRLWSHITPRRRVQFAILFVLMILASFAEILSIGAVVPFLGVLTAPERVFSHELAQPLVRALDLKEPKDLMLPLTIAFATAALFSGIMRLAMLFAQTRLSYAVGADFSLSIYRRTLYQPYAVHAKRNSSKVIAAITTKTTSVVHHTLLSILSILSSILLIVAIAATLFVIEPHIAMIAMGGFGAIYLLIILFTRRHLLRFSRSVAHEQNRAIKALQEGLGAIRDVLIDGAQAAYCKVYRSADMPMRRAQANIQIIAGSPRFAIEALGMVFIAVLAYSLAIRPEGLLAAIAALGALALGAQRLLPILQLCFAGWSNLRGGQAALSDALDLLDQPIPAYADAPQPAPIPFSRAIKLDNLRFRYSEDGPWVLDGITLDIRKGSWIGFIGSTGSGKSTLIDIVMGLLPPTEGALRIDGAAIADDNHRAWQAHLAHVPQVIFLTDSTVAENIAFGIPAAQIDRERVREAARDAQISETIESWEDQYDTVVGERGVRLSGGQRQRIGIARALYKRADVIVLDEATSALDSATEEAVMQGIERLGDGLTVLVVAHRLTTLRKCTHVVELLDGKIKRIGTYQEIVGVAS